MKFNEMCDFIIEANVYRDAESGMSKEFGVPYITKGRQMIMDPMVEAKIRNISTTNREYKLSQLASVLASQARGISASPIALQKIIDEIFDTQKMNAESMVSRPGLVIPLDVDGIKDIIKTIIKEENNISEEDATSRKAGILNRAADRIFPWLSKQKFIRPMSQLDKENDKTIGAMSAKQRETSAIEDTMKHLERGGSAYIPAPDKLEVSDAESLLGRKFDEEI
jgi:hypothetical protein